MSATVTYKGATLTTVNNETKVLNTAGTWVEGDISITDVSSGAVEDKFVSVTFNNHSETCILTLTYVTGSNLVNGSSGYVEMTTNVAILAATGSVTRLMPYGFPLTVRTPLTTNVNTQNFELRMNGSVVDPIDEGMASNGRYLKLYNITKTNLSDSNNTLDFYSISDPFKDTVITDSLSVTANGTYTATAGTAYNEVTVNVPTPTPTLQSKTATPTESTQTVTADSGYDGLSSVEVGAISSTYVGSGIDRRSSSDLAASGATVTVPAGYYEASASKAVASGTAGTPTATKGTVSNHSISVTPSVTNTTGYITGGTKNGTAVTVAASELVSGTLTIDSSGTKDVTNYASASVPAGTAGTPSATKGTVSNHQVSVTPSVTNTTGWITGGTKSGTAVTVTASELASGNKAITDNGTNIDVVGYSTVSVAVPFSTIYSGSSDPSSSTGSNGDVYIKTAS